MQQYSERKMNCPLVSVIVPVYDVQQYLSDCVDSILAQTFGDFELILVDDGSPDNCGVLCDQYAEKDPRVRVIHQKNQGPSGARNAGMDIATGEYFTFIDGDDVVAVDFFAHMMCAIEKETADIAVCPMFRFEDGEDISYNLLEKKQEPVYKRFSNRDACVELYSGKDDVSINAWGKFFRAELVADVRFPIGRVHEDQAFIPIVCYKANKIVSINRKLYCYRKRQGSITHNTFYEKRYDDLWAIDSCIQFFETRQETEIVNAAKKKRQMLLCVYAIYARRDKVSVPEEYRVNIWRALLYLRKHSSESFYEYYLAQVHPQLAVLFEYEIKIRKMLGIYKK